MQFRSAALERGAGKEGLLLGCGVGSKMYPRGTVRRALRGAAGNELWDAGEAAVSSARRKTFRG